MVVIDLINDKQIKIKMIGESDEEGLFYNVRVRGDNVYFLTYAGKDNLYNHIVQYNVLTKKLSVVYEADKDIVNYFLSPDGKTGFALLNSPQGEGFILQGIEAGKAGSGSFVNIGDPQVKTPVRKIHYAPQGDGLLLELEDLNNPKAVCGTYIGSYNGPKLQIGNPVDITSMVKDSVPYKAQTLMVKNPANRRSIPVNYYSTPTKNGDAPRALVVDLHGGPHRCSFSGYAEEIHELLNKGYNILEINYGGSTGFGKQFTKCIDGDFGGEECSDIVVAIDYICQNYKDIDRKNVFITGASYGGYLTVLLGLKYPDLAKGLIAISGQYDWSSSLGVLAKAKDKVSNDEYNMRLTPYKFMHLLKAPLLLVHGRFDDICPIEEATKAYDAAVSAQKPVSLYVHDTDHFYSEWWINKVTRVQAMSFLEDLRRGTYQPLIFNSSVKPTCCQENEVICGDTCFASTSDMATSSNTPTNSVQQLLLQFQQEHQQQSKKLLQEQKQRQQDILQQYEQQMKKQQELQQQHDKEVQEHQQQLQQEIQQRQQDTDRLVQEYFRRQDEKLQSLLKAQQQRSQQLGDGSAFYTIKLAIVSMWLVCGYISAKVRFCRVYPLSTIIFASRAKVAGLHET